MSEKGKYTGVKLQTDAVGNIVMNSDLAYRHVSRQHDGTWVYNALTLEPIVYADWLRDNPHEGANDE